MAELKTKPNDGSVSVFLQAIEDDRKREDCFKVLEIMQEASGEPPIMWGDSIIGFGRYKYRYASGREGDWPLTGFSPRKRDLTLYIMPGFDRYEDLLSSLGKHKLGKSCLYIKKLEDIDLKVLSELIRQSVSHMRSSSAE